jgi:ABC-type transport system involved in multi-copper enzyme maturation permease subunit
VGIGRLERNMVRIRLVWGLVLPAAIALLAYLAYATGIADQVGVAVIIVYGGLIWLVGLVVLLISSIVRSSRNSNT